MRFSRIILATCGLVLLISLGAITWAVREQKLAETARVGWVKNDATLRVSLARAHAADADSTREVANLAKDRTQGAPPLRTRQKAPPGWMTVLAAQPELQADFERAYRARRDHAYGVFYEQLHLSRSQIDQLDELTAKNAEDSADLAAAAQEQNLATNDSAIAKQQKDLTEELHEQEKAILGVQAYVALQTFDNESPVRNMVSDASTFLLFSDTPLTGDQQEQLTQLLAQSSKAFQTNPAKPVSPSTVDWDTALSQAQSIVSPSQAAALHAESQLQRLWALENKFFVRQTSASK